MDNILKAKATIDNECLNCGDGKISKHSNKEGTSFAAIVDMEALVDGGGH